MHSYVTRHQQRPQASASNCSCAVISGAAIAMPFDQPTKGGSSKGENKECGFHNKQTSIALLVR